MKIIYYNINYINLQKCLIQAVHITTIFFYLFWLILEAIEIWNV